MADFDFARHLANRPLAIDESRLPAINAAAQLRIAQAGGNVPQAAGGRSRPGLPTVIERGVAIIQVSGTIVPGLSWLDFCDPDLLCIALREADGDPSIKSILLVFDSPGGSVALIPETAAVIRSLHKPITGIARIEAASAAYWLLAQCDMVIATPSCVVGSIGVFILHIDQSKLNERVGLVPKYIFAGAHKTEGNPNEPLQPEAQAFIQREVDGWYGKFLSAVANGRNTTVERVRSEFGQGRCFGAEEALRRGMVDKIATLDQTLTMLLTTGIMTRRARADRTQLVLAGADPKILGPESDMSIDRRAQAQAQAQADRDLLATTLAMVRAPHADRD